METTKKVFQKVNTICTGGSGCLVEKLTSVDLKFFTVKAFTGSSYIPTTPQMEKMKSTQHQGLFWRIYFLFCVAAAVFPVDQNRKRPSYYLSRLIELVFDPNNIPMKIEDIPKLEQKILGYSIPLPRRWRSHYALVEEAKTCSAEKNRSFAPNKRRNVSLLSHHQLPVFHP